VDNCVFENNYVIVTGGGSGAAINLNYGPATIRNSQFVGNFVTASTAFGGAYFCNYFFVDQPNMFTNTTCLFNFVSGSGQADGGAIYSGQTLLLSGGIFKGNTANSPDAVGGAISVPAGGLATNISISGMCAYGVNLWFNICLTPSGV